jgi:hypothetical protein
MPVAETLADPAARCVELPAGRFRVSSATDSVAPKRSNLRITGRDTTLVPDGYSLPVNVWCDPIQNDDGSRREIRATGTITATTDSLAVDDASGLTVGDRVLLRYGVNSSDPAEPEGQVWLTVAAIEGTTIYFTLPINRTPRVFDSYKQLGTLSGYQEKTGDWQNLGGSYNRGLGLDHGIVTFSGGQPISDVSIEGVTVEWPAEHVPVAGDTSFVAQWCERVTFRDVTVINPRGNCVRLCACDDSGFDGLAIRGDAKADAGGGNITHSAIIDLWGGNGCHARSIRAEGADLLLLNAQAGSLNFRLDDWSLRTVNRINVPGVQFGAYGPHPGLAIDNGCLDVPTNTFTLIPGNGTPMIGPITFPSDVPGYLQLPRERWLGPIHIGSRSFGPPRYVRCEFMSGYHGGAIPAAIPRGLYVSGNVVLPSRVGIENVTPADFSAQPADALTIPLTAFAQVPPGNIDQYLSDIQGKVQVWVTYCTEQVRCHFEGVYYPEI